MTIIQQRRFWLSVALGITLLAILVMLLLASTQRESRSRGQTSAGMTVSPLFDDPRLTENPEPIADFADEATIPPDVLRAALVTIQDDFNATDGVQDCQVYLLRIGAINTNCTVDAGYNRLEMAELFRLLVHRYFTPSEFSVTLTDAEFSMTYVWNRGAGYWGFKPEQHPSFEDPRLSLVIAYNPPANLNLTVTAIPATPDPRSHIERIQAYFDDTPHIQRCQIIYSYEENNQGHWYGSYQQLDAICTVDTGYNSLEMAEWLRRLANRAFIRGNFIACESMEGCDAQLNQLSMSLILTDSGGSTHYSWNNAAEYWTIVDSVE